MFSEQERGDVYESVNRVGVVSGTVGYVDRLMDEAAAKALEKVADSFKHAISSDIRIDARGRIQTEARSYREQPEGCSTREGRLMDDREEDIRAYAKEYEEDEIDLVYVLGLLDAALAQTDDSRCTTGATAPLTHAEKLERYGAQTDDGPWDKGDSDEDICNPDLMRTGEDTDGIPTVDGRHDSGGVSGDKDHREVAEEGEDTDERVHSVDAVRDTGGSPDEREVAEEGDTDGMDKGNVADVDSPSEEAQEVAEDELEGLGALLIAHKMASGKELWAIEHRIRTLFTKQGEEQRHEGIVIGHAEAQVDAESLQSQLAEKDDKLKFMISDRNHGVLELGRMKQAKEAAESEVDTLRYHLKASEKLVQAEQSEVTALREKIEDFSARISALQSRYGKSHAEVTALKERLAKATDIFLQVPGEAPSPEEYRKFCDKSYAWLAEAIPDEGELWEACRPSMKGGE